MKAFPALAAILSLVTALLAGCSTAPSSTAPTSTVSSSVSLSGRASGTRTTGPHPSAIRVFGRIFDNPGATVTGGRLYVTWRVNAATAPVPQFELTRVDQVNGAIEAAHLLIAGQAGTPLSAGGRLLRVSLITGQVLASIPLPGTATSGVAANRAGTVLVVSEASDSGIGSVQRRDPVTGALLASHPVLGVSAPALGGIVDSGVWVSEPTGMLGYVERFRTATMAPVRATDVGGDNGIDGVVADSVVWITDLAAPDHDYCADPVTGRVLARIQLPNPRQDALLAVSDRYLYYQSPASGGFYLDRVAVPAAC